MFYKLLLTMLFILCTNASKADDVDSITMAGFQADKELLSWENTKHTPIQGYKNSVYWKRHKVLRSCAWSAFGVGLGCTAVGYVGCVVSFYTGSRAGVFPALFTGGVCLTASSLPLFIFSYTTKKKANQAYLTTGNIQSYSPGMNQQQPALSLHVYF